MASEDTTLIVDTIKYSQKQLDAIEKQKEKELDVYRKKITDNWNDQQRRTIGDKKESDRQWKEDSALLVAADKRDADREAREESNKMRERAHEEKNAQLLEGLTGFAKLAEIARQKAEKLKKVDSAKIKDWGLEKLANIKKSASSLLDLFKKGLGLAALWLLFKAIQKIDWEALVTTAGKIGEAVTGIIDFLWTLSTRIGAFLGIDKLRQLFGGKEGKLAARLRRQIRVMFVSAKIWVRRIRRFLRGFVGKGSFLSRIGGFFRMLSIFRFPGLGKLLKFVKFGAKMLGRIFIPVTVLMALWDAVTGFIKGFGETEGNFFQKMLGGIGGALKGLLDFFIFGIADMVQSAIVWLLEMFGFDSAAVAVGDFNLVGRIKDAVFKVIDFVTELFSFRDTSLSGIFKSLVDILMLPLNLAVNFLKNLFGWGDPEEPFKFSTFVVEMWDNAVAWIKEKLTWASEGIAAGWTSLTDYLSGVWTDVKAWFSELFSFAKGEDTDSSDDGFMMTILKDSIDGIKAWFGKMFKFDSASDILASIINVLTFMPNLVKDAVLSVTEWLLGLFGFDEAAKKVANAKEWSIGGMIMSALDGIITWLSELFNFDLKAWATEKMGALGKAGSWLLEKIGIGDEEETKVKGQSRGGPVGAGAPILVGEHGPELFVPSASGRVLPKMQTENALTEAGGAPTIINAPTTSNVSSGSTSMAIASSSINPMKDKYFRMA